MIDFKTRGHFCNYCRKIMYNKLTKEFPLGANGVININTTLWHVWEANSKETINSFISDLSNIEVKGGKGGVRNLNNKLQSLCDKYK